MCYPLPESPFRFVATFFLTSPVWILSLTCCAQLKPSSYFSIKPLLFQSRNSSEALITSGYNCFFPPGGSQRKQTDLSVLTLLAPHRSSLCSTSLRKGHVQQLLKVTGQPALLGDNPVFTSSVFLHHARTWWDWSGRKEPFCLRLQEEVRPHVCSCFEEMK